MTKVGRYQRRAWLFAESESLSASACPQLLPARLSLKRGSCLTVDVHGSKLVDHPSFVRDYRSSLKERRLGPASLNAALAAIDHLYRFLRLGPPSVRREALPAQVPRSLCPAELAGHRS